MRRRHAELELDAADLLVGPLGHHPLGVQEVTDDAEDSHDDGGVEEHRAEDERLHVAGAVALDEVGEEEATERDQREREQDERDEREDL